MFLGFLCMASFAASQADEPVVRESIVRHKGAIIGITQYDRQGNNLLSINDGMNGPVTMVFAWEYDSTGKPTRTLSAHSNVGSFVSEHEYTPGEHHSYSRNPYAAEVAPAVRGDEYRKVLAALRSAADIASLPEVRALLSGPRYRSGTELLDTAGRTLEDYRFNDQGDTIGHNSYGYDAAGEEIYFRYSGGSPDWTWEYFAVLDSVGRKVRWARVQEHDGARDTTELEVYRYDADGRMTDHLRYSEGQLRYEEHYTYDANGHMIETRAMNSPEPDRVWLTKYKRQCNGLVVRERHYEVVRGRSRMDHDYRMSYTYW